MTPVTADYALWTLDVMDDHVCSCNSPTMEQVFYRCKDKGNRQVFGLKKIQRALTFLTIESCVSSNNIIELI